MFNYDYIIAISLGAVLGALLRWGIGLVAFPVLGSSLIGTLSVNLIGCFFIGLAYVIFANADYPEVFKLFIIVGFLGSLTTFSTFSLEVVSLIRASNMSLAMLVIAANVIGSLMMTFLGIALAMWVRKG
ncbi:fluoride efflux transporter CrcB [Neisseriaceae bacterium PsAf]|nr:fluoride efflux transporter CrcB [Neisseriaceae bacterium PsAf]